MMPMSCINVKINVTSTNDDWAFGEQMAVRSLHCIIGILANHCLPWLHIILSLKEVMAVLLITGMEMKGDLEEFTLVESKSLDLVVESSNAGGRGEQTSVC